MNEAPAPPAAENAAPRQSSPGEVRAALTELRGQAVRWAASGAAERAALAGRLRTEVGRSARRWVEVSCRIKGLSPSDEPAAEEWLAGPYSVLRFLRLIEEAFGARAAGRRASFVAAPRRLASGHLAVGVMPGDRFDKVLLRRMTADVWLRPATDLADALEWRHATGEPQVALVLGAGNVSSIPALDVLDQLLLHGRVVVLKMNPVNATLGLVLGEALAPLLISGLLRIVYGGAALGALLCADPGVDTVHITGSDATFEAIVFGAGDEGARRKAARRLQLAKPVTGELGNVSPVIVVPGPWSSSDFAWQGRAIAAQVVNNAGCNCNAARVIVQHAGWPGREQLLLAIAESLAAIPPRVAWYPGMARRFSAFATAHPEARRLGTPTPDALPWLLIDGLDPLADDEICFRTEAFCGVVGETGIVAGDVEGFLDRAVEFANRRLWGTLSACIVIHPATLTEPAMAAVLERAIARLEFGTIGINVWPAAGYAFGATPWGAFPGGVPWDIQSGTGFVHNAALLDGIEKAVVRGPFRPLPAPPWIPGARHPLAVARALTSFEQRPGWRAVATVLAAVVAGLTVPDPEGTASRLDALPDED